MKTIALYFSYYIENQSTELNAILGGREMITLFGDNLVSFFFELKIFNLFFMKYLFIKRKTYNFIIQNVNHTHAI